MGWGGNVSPGSWLWEELPTANPSLWDRLDSMDLSAQCSSISHSLSKIVLVCL